MEQKTYNPQKGLEGLSVTVPIGGAPIEIDGWPYTTDEGAIQRVLDEHPLVTDGSDEQNNRGGLAEPDGGEPAEEEATAEEVPEDPEEEAS